MFVHISDDPDAENRGTRLIGAGKTKFAGASSAGFCTYRNRDWDWDWDRENGRAGA